MTRTFTYIAPFLLLLTASLTCFSQSITVRAALDRNKILIGEPIRLQLEATVPTGTEANWFPLDSLAHFEFIDKGKIDTIPTSSGKTYRQTLTITSFDSGRWAFPALPVQSGNKAYLTDSIPVSVAYANFDPNQDYHDIKDILDVPNPNTGYVNWLLGGLVLLSLLGLIWFLRKKPATLPQTVVVKKPVSKLPPLQEALQSLAELEKQGPAANGEAKAFHTRLSDIFRWYLYRRAGWSTLEKTSGELLVQLKQYSLPPEAFTRLGQTLRMGDAVKFAKYRPEAAENEASLRTLRESLTELDKIISS